MFKKNREMVQLIKLYVQGILGILLYRDGKYFKEMLIIHENLQSNIKWKKKPREICIYFLSTKHHAYEPKIKIRREVTKMLIMVNSRL